MKSVIFVTFGVLGWAWYELSGGADFVPGQNGVQVLASIQTDTRDEVVEPEVTRASVQASDLASVASVSDAVVTRAKATESSPAKVIDASAGSVIPADPAKFAALLDASERDADVVTVAAEVLNDSPERSDLRTVSGSRVNLREGPSTAYPVVTQLLRGEDVEVLDDSGDGWVRLRALDGDNVGWMSDSFLAAAN